ncbi:MAG: NUDIX hydrolase [Oscillatoria sp. PMC 1051.18]|nr:NUDIX hydrolase [Oscillatoria sp. PMC 1050.18]MEC5032803.1 NUDIX hydrolase [Oscillatoria sp. PMC 1051.18]
MSELRKWKILASRLVLDNIWCRVRQDTIQLPNGKIIDDYFVNVRPEIAVVLPVTSNQEVVFVRQYRHGVEEILLELPAGRFNSDSEVGETAAARELTEETGYIAEKLVKLATLFDNPPKDTNRIHLYIALNVTPTGKQQLDLTEEIEVVLVPLTEVKAKIFAGEICVSGTIAAIFLGLNYLEQHFSNV